MFVLHSSKTHGKGNKPQIIKIDNVGKLAKGNQSPTNALCPFTLLKNYVSIRRKYQNSEEQFFVFRDGTPVTANNLRMLMSKLLKFNRIDSSLYSTQAFHAGRASDLLHMGVWWKPYVSLGDGSHQQFTLT